MYDVGAGVGVAEGAAREEAAAAVPTAAEGADDVALGLSAPVQAARRTAAAANVAEPDRPRRSTNIPRPNSEDAFNSPAGVNPSFRRWGN